MTKNLPFIALNIVYNVWTLPSNKIREKALKIIQRFWRRCSGYHQGYVLFHIPNLNISYPNDDKFSSRVLPPVLYRQTNGCHGHCLNTPIRIQTMIADSLREMNSSSSGYLIVKVEKVVRPLTPDEERNRSLINGCGCNWKHYLVYERLFNMVTNLSNTKHKKNYTRQIYHALSQDTMSFQTRGKVSYKLLQYLKQC
jgi:hypothetical protein